jgi:hypothetical protein
MSFYYSTNQLKSLLTIYFSGGASQFSQYLMKLGKRGSGGEELLVMIGDVARATQILEDDEFAVVACRHAGYLFREIRERLGIKMNKISDLYRTALIRMIGFLDGK